MSSLLRKIRRGTAVIYSNGFNNAVCEKKHSTVKQWRFACKNSVVNSNNINDYFPK
ncbi:MAG: hypothetical protein LBN27_05945 [Prevotellaceae bacterium]|jgi:hypothetical protein|nr:hypothetical protein [Prevotellaceae bacterium]